MTDRPSLSYEELQGRVRGLLIVLSPQLPAKTVGLIDETIDANEVGLALETLSEMLVEAGGRISAQVLSDVASLVDAMGLDPLNADRLRPLVSLDTHQENCSGIES